MAEIPIHERKVVFTLPGMDDVVVQHNLIYHTADGEDLRMDVYQPPAAQMNGRLPGVVFIHGGPVMPKRNVKESGQYRSWGALAAASGFIGFTFNHRYFAPEMMVQSAEDVLAAIAHIRDKADSYNLDPDRIILWSCSGGGPHICFALRDQPTYIRGLILYYALLDLHVVEHFSTIYNENTLQYFSPSSYVDSTPVSFPIFIARAGQDYSGLNQIVDDFVHRALRNNLTIEVMNHPAGKHGFDILDDDERSRQIISRTLAFMLERI